MTTLHEDELGIDAALVRRLVDAQLPEYAALPVVRLATSGSTNTLFGLGESLLVRLPRLAGGSETLLKEARWLPTLAPRLPVPVPEVVAVGTPAFGYPEHWLVVRRLAGDHPAPGRAAFLADDLAAFVDALRSVPVPAGALADPALRWYRAEPLMELDAGFREDVRTCRAVAGLGLDLDAALGVWEDAMALPPAREQQARWLHADLLAENLLVREGRLAAVLDFGGLAVGDPTVDLVAAWELLDPDGRAAFRAALDVDDRSWLLGRAWALAIALMTFAYYWETMPDRCASRLVMAHAVLDDASGP